MLLYLILTEESEFWSMIKYGGKRFIQLGEMLSYPVIASDNNIYFTWVISSLLNELWTKWSPVASFTNMV